MGLCDDEICVHEIVEHLLEDYEKRNEVKCELLHYYSGNELLEDNTTLDFLLLDIDMPRQDGIETAMKLRKFDVSYKIIMLTGREDRYREAFKIGAFRFIPKPINNNDFFKTIDEVREHLVGMEEVTVYRDGVSYSIAQRDIAYIEADRSSTLVFTRNSEYRSENSLSKWKEMLDEHVFFQCHKSYIVNMGKIADMETNILKLVTGDKVKVSKRQRIPLLHAFMEYDTKHR